MKGFMKFLTETNALALAIGVIIGGAVGKVVGSIVSDLLMPVISLAMPAGDWRAAKIALTRNPDGTAAKALGIGSFIGTFIDFVIIAFVVYMITRQILKPAPAAAKPATKTCGECLETVPAAARKCRACASPV